MSTFARTYVQLWNLKKKKKKTPRDATQKKIAKFAIGHHCQKEKKLPHGNF
jgi:hypothetical protein